MKRGIIFLFIVTVMISGCSKRDHKEFKYAEIDYIIVDAIDIPKLVQEEINNLKYNVFQFAYSDGEYLYITIGYGEQPTGGYSIKVKHVGQSNNKIFVETTLAAPGEEEEKITKVSYPYVVIKLKDKGLEVEYSTH